AFLKMEWLALRDQVLDWLKLLIMRLDHDTTLVLVVATKAYRTIDFRDDSVILRTTRFEQLGNARETTGNVLGLGTFHRNTSKHVTRLDDSTRLDRQNCLNREHDASIAALGELMQLALFIHDGDGRLQIDATWCRTPIDDLTLGDTGRLIR